jgi:hypothetical protein
MGIPLLGVLPVSEGLLSSLRVVQQHAERVIFWTAEQEDVGNYRATCRTLTQRNFRCGGCVAALRIAYDAGPRK